jgi:hypothetical protein
MFEDERIPKIYFEANILHDPWINDVFESYQCN